MKMKWPYLIAMIALVFWSGNLAGHIVDHQGPDTIVIASEPDYPPYCYVDDQGAPAGFALEVFREAAKAAALKVFVRIGIWSQIKEDLAMGKIDALPFVGRTPEREQLFDFTMPYLSLTGAAFVRKEYGLIKTVEDLQGKDIAVMKGDNAEEFLVRDSITNRIITTLTFEEAFRLLSDGKCDAVVTQRIMGLSLLDKMGVDNVEALDFRIPRFRQDFCFAVKEGDSALLSRLNEGLSVIVANDIYPNIHHKWFGPKESPFISWKTFYKYLFYILVPIVILLSFAFILFLRGEVKRRTKRLKTEVSEHKKTLHSLRQNQIHLEQSETQIRLLLNSTAEGIFSIDLEGNCTLINSSALRILNYSGSAGILDKNIHRLIHHTHPDGAQYSEKECPIHEALHNGKSLHITGEVFWTRDGRSFPVEYFAYPIIENDAVQGVVVTFWDVTEMKRSEAELRKLKDDLEKKVAERTAQLNEKVKKLDRSQKAMLFMVEDLNKITAELKAERHKLEISNQELEAFTYSVSHDLRAPLRAINGFSGFLLEDYADKLDDEGRRFIHTIRNNATRMDKLITDLLNLSRISRAEMKTTVIDMQALARDVFDETAAQSEKETFSLSIDHLLPAKGDPALIRQVWQNLIGNALKYSSKSDTKKIEIYSRQNAESISYCIRDHGAGFNNKYTGKLFGIFQRLHNEKEFEGTGVGLAIVKRIIQRHGGTIRGEGEINKGTVFCFDLPIH